ncbi:hypothetical protein QBC38DRAFT_477141, partial [Podospora fimiseda]
PEILVSPPSSQASLLWPSTTGSGGSSFAARSLLRPSAVPSPVRSPANNFQSPPSKNCQPPPVLRRIQVLAQQSGQGPSRVQPAPGGGKEGVPRVRVTSPPAWLKGSGVSAPVKPEPTVRRRWTWEDKRSNAKGRESSSKSSMATILEVGNRRQRVNDGSGSSEISPRDGASPIGSGKRVASAGTGFARLSAQNLARKQSEILQISASTASRNWSQKLPSSTPPINDSTQTQQQRRDVALRPKLSSRGSEVSTTVTAMGTYGTSVIFEEIDVSDVGRWG